MAAAASSYFAGPAIMPPQRAAAASDNSSVVTPSPAKSSRDPRFSGCAPTTVRHIARSFAAADATGGGDSVISIDGVDATNVWVLGRAVNVVNMEAGVSFTLDDGTGKIPLVRWITDDIDVNEVSFVQNGLYLKVQVTLLGFKAKQHCFARSIRPVTNFNDVVLHFIECMYVHLVNVCPKMQGQFPCTVQANVSTHEMQAQVTHTVQTNAPAYMPSSGGVREHQVDFAPGVNQGRFPSSVQTSTSTHVPFSGGGVREHQVDFAPGVNQGRFPSSVQTNTSTHVPFSGGVREHQTHFTPQPNQFSAYPGTGGQQHNLQNMVMEVMQQPDILALENGVHVDEVARRLGIPRAQIMVTAQHLVDLACLYSTIDEYHFKSLLNC